MCEQDLLRSVEVLLLQDLWGLNTVGFWFLALVCSPQDTGLSIPFLEPSIKFLMRQKCRQNVKSRKIKARYSIWCLKLNTVQQNPFGITFVYIIYLFLKKTTSPRRWQCRHCRAHSTWNALAVSQWGLLVNPYPAQSHVKSSCLQKKAKVNCGRNGVGICWKHEHDCCFLQQKI